MGGLIDRLDGRAILWRAVIVRSLYRDLLCGRVEVFASQRGSVELGMVLLLGVVLAVSLVVGYLGVILSRFRNFSPVFCLSYRLPHELTFADFLQSTAMAVTGQDQSDANLGEWAL